MACLQLSYEIGTQVPFHKALAFVYKKVYKMFLTLWNNTIGRLGKRLLSVSSKIVSLVSVKKASEQSTQSLEHEEYYEY